MSYVDQLLGENENVVLVARQSWVVLLRDTIINLIGALIVIGLTLVAGGSVPQPFGWFVGLLILIPAGRFAVQFLHWANREYIVTNRRVIQIRGLVNKNVVDSSLEKVNDVRMSQSIWGRVLNYGDVEILTASDIGANLIQRIGAPIRFKTAMLNEKEKMGYDETPTHPALPAPRATEIPAMIASLNALKTEGLITEEEFQKKKAELLARM